VVVYALVLCNGAGAAEKSSRQTTGSPPVVSTERSALRYPVVKKHRLNKLRFCPPGLGRKPGHASAFHC
jgi:hypothetical protein